MVQADKKINIAIVIPTLDKGGAERVLLHFVNNLDHNRYHPIILCLKKKGDLLPLVDPNVTVVDLDCPRVYFSLPKIKKELRKHNVDVLIGWMGHVNALLAFFRPTLPSKLVLLCRESSIPSQFILHYRAPGLFRFMYRFMNRYDGIVCQSQAMKEDLVEHFRVKPAKIKVIHNPVVQSKGEMTISATAAAFIKGSRMVLFVGRFSAEKQVGLLIEAMRGLPPEYRLVLLGYGPLETEVKNKINEQGVGDRVLIVNDCNDPTPYYKVANCLVLTSSFEGFPNVLLEANLQGCPVVVYKTKGGAREIVVPGSGIYIEPETPDGLAVLRDTIIGICEHPEKFDRERIALRIKEEYEVKRTIKTYLDYIEDILRKKQAS